MGHVTLRQAQVSPRTGVAVMVMRRPGFEAAPPITPSSDRTLPLYVFSSYFCVGQSPSLPCNLEFITIFPCWGL